MNTVIELGPQEIVKGRSFTHPNHTFYDHRTLKYIIRRAREILMAEQLITYETSSISLQQREADGRYHRLIITNTAVLMQEKQLMVVGFFGQRRNDADPTPILSIDKQLLAELPLHPSLLSYCTMELTNGDYANCVLFKDDEAMIHWSRSESHRQQALKLAPAYYRSVRIFNGRLPKGIHQPDRLQLLKAKYYDYGRSGCWRAERQLEAAVPEA